MDDVDQQEAEVTDATLVPSSRFDWAGRKRERVVRCYLAKVHMVADGRNAWHSTWVRRYRSYDGFYPTLRQAKLGVEPRRVQGSTWVIHELPAIIIGGSRTQSFIFEINSQRPFSYRPPDLRSAITLFTLTNRWVARPGHEVFRRVSPYLLDVVTLLPFSRHTSESDGPGYSLRWRQRASQVRIDGALEHITAVSQSLQQHL